MPLPRERATVLLQRMREGDADAADDLLPLIYGELHEIARKSFRGQDAGHTLQPTALVNEAWVRLMDGAGAGWNDRAHFMRVAATAMRHVLVDHARGKSRVKRGRRADVPPEALDQLMGVFEDRSIDVLALHAALERLASFDERMAHVVELRFFGGHTVEEAAEILGVSDTTVERTWRLARAWLQRELGDEG